MDRATPSLARRIGAVVLSAGLYTLAFPPSGLAPLVWVALVPLLWAAVTSRPGAAAALGLLWGVLACFGTSWFLPGMLMRFFDWGPAAAGSLYLGIALALAGSYFAAFAAWISWLATRGPVPPFLVGFAWLACEMARAHLLVPNPWALSGIALAGSPMMIQSAALLGPFALSFLVGVSNGWLAGLLTPRLVARSPVLAASGVALLFAAVVLYGAARLGQEMGDGEAAEVVLVQGAVDPALRFDPEARDANLSHHIALSERAALQHTPRLVVWPEFSIDFYLRDDVERRKRLASYVRDSEAELLLGGPDYRPHLSGVEYTNSVFLLRTGRLAGRYDKVRLMPFSETNPLRDFVAIGPDRLTPGKAPEPLETALGPVGVLICSEAMLPAAARESALRGAEVFVNPSNDDYFGHPSAARHQLLAAALRAVENHRPLLRAAASGITAVIDPGGRVVAEAPYGEAALLAAEVRSSRAVTPYQLLGDWPAVVGCAVAVAWTLARGAAPFLPRSTR